MVAVTSFLPVSSCFGVKNMTTRRLSLLNEFENVPAFFFSGTRLIPTRRPPGRGKRWSSNRMHGKVLRKRGRRNVGKSRVSLESEEDDEERERERRDIKRFLLESFPFKKRRKRRT